MFMGSTLGRVFDVYGTVARKDRHDLQLCGIDRHCL
jgi:hypothetical protein